MVHRVATPRGIAKFPWCPGTVTMAAVLVLACQDPNPAEDSLSSRVPAESKADFALRFDATNDYATLGTARFPLPTNAQCLSLWVRPASSGEKQALLTLRREDSGEMLGISAEGYPTLWRIWSQEVVVQSAEPWTTGVWHHLAYVNTTTEHELYVDGARVSAQTHSTDNRSPTTAWLGTYDGTQALFDGELDEVRIWVMARTKADIDAELQGEGVRSDPDLVGYYSFNEDSGARVYDRSGNGNHLTLGDGVSDYQPARVLSSRPQ